MLKIKTYTGQDQYGGTGLFAAEDIAKGTLIWDYDSRFTRYIPAQEYLDAPPEIKAEYEKHTYPVHDPEGGFVGVFLNLDDSKYTNHSVEPNIGSIGTDTDKEFALRDIAKGEELTCNYLEFDPENVLYKMGVYSCKRFLIEDATPYKKKSTRDR